MKLTDKPLFFIEYGVDSHSSALSSRNRKVKTPAISGEGSLNELKLADKPLSFHRERSGQSFICSFLPEPEVKPPPFLARVL
ncbi:hypothetical protein, partial [Raoultella planticola]|uniref:hypothetical protein n=1 Tax=Raoultella planticola TaxID=575 RepID=UPI001B3143F9